MTFGGYDTSRLVPNNVTFDLGLDISRDLVVYLQSIKTTIANGSVTPLLSSSILTFIDSTLPYIYLPLEVCQAFEEEFGLTYNETEFLYTINDTVHQGLLAKNPNFTFQIANAPTGGPTVDIVLPYASFDLLFSYPGLNPSNYFPLQRATNESQYTLGRTFLQEAYAYHSITDRTVEKADLGVPDTSSPTMSSPTFLYLKLDLKMAFAKTLLPFPQSILLPRQSPTVASATNLS